MNKASSAHSFQFGDARHQRETAIAGMWAFLATECLFFGPLFLAWAFSRHFNQRGFDFGAAQTNFTVGTVNTILLITSSFTYGVAQWALQAGRRRAMTFGLIVSWLCGAVFLLLKFAVEWPDDIHRGFFPGPSFSIPEPEHDGAALFFSLYFLGTAVHGAHVAVGLVLLAWIISRTRARPEAALTQVTNVGLYWTFVDIVWIILFPLIYLWGRAT